ncbi:MAG TPA: chemotaxis protein CheW [Gammaproteobacteria bacterium]|jgi:chemosensory pili system protein ChpC|nr:chemotaxis protein CheW [Xanthomonadales bacterium]HPQ87260.1 chemotaxis protein CheW [Gammaproteobacteria bacterium]
MSNEIRGIMIPVTTEKRVLLPNAIIAEVVTYTDLQSIDNAPDWLSGKIDWRGYDVPVLCYNSLSTGGSTAKRSKTGRVVVVKALGDNEKIPYFALLVEGVPRLQLITQGDLQVHEVDSDISNAIASMVTVQDEMSEIPNIKFIEYVLAESI